MNALNTLPEENVTINDVVEKLIFIEEVKKSLKDAEEGHTVSHEEAGRRIAGIWQP